MNPRCLVLWTSVCDLARGEYVFGIIPTGFGKSLIFQLFPRLAKAALILENYTIIVVSPLTYIMYLLLVPNMVISKMNNHEHRTKQTYESYTFQPLMSFWFLAGQGHVFSAS